MAVSAFLVAALALAAPAPGEARSGNVGTGLTGTATGTASVRIQRGFRLTRDAFAAGVEGARARKAFITERNGDRRAAHLIEFE